MATEIQRILIKYEADIKQLKTQLDTIQGELKDTEKVSDKSTKEVQRDFEKTAKSAGGVTNALKSVGKAIAAAYSVREIIQFTKESVRLADVQLKAEAQLLTALKGRKEAQQELIKQAADLQKKTTFGDEETIAAQARIAAFVQEVDQIKELTRVSQDFASAKGIDLATASDLITKSFASSTNALSRYGIEIEGTAGSSERLTNIVKGLDNAFKGQAEVIARTGLGPLIQLQNAVGDIREEIGKAILNELPGFTAELTKAVNITAEFTKQLFDAQQRTGTIGSAASTTQKAIDALTKSFELLTEPMNQVISLFKSMSIEIPGTGKEINLFEGYIKGVGIVLEQLVTRRIEDAIKAFQYLGAGIQGVRAALVPGGESFLEAFNRTLNESRGLVAQKGSLLGDEFGNSFGQGYIRGVGFAGGGKSAEDILAEVLASEEGRKKLAEESKKLGGATGENIAKGIKESLESLSGVFDLSVELDGIGLSTETSLTKLGILLEGALVDRFENLKMFKEQLNSELFSENDEDIRVLGATPEEYLAAVDTYEEFTQGIAQANQQLALDSAAAGLQIFQSITSAITDSAALNSAFLAFEKIATIAQIAINLGKEISTISASAAPTDFLSPDAGLSRKAALISFAKVRAGINIASVIATAIPQFQFEKGTSYGPGAEALVGEKGPERMYVPKGARIYTSEATKKESKLIDALNAGKHEDFIHDHYIRPFAAQMMQRTQEPYNDFQLRQAIKGNKVVKLHPETMRKLAPVKIKRYR